MTEIISCFPALWCSQSTQKNWLRRLPSTQAGLVLDIFDLEDVRVGSILAGLIACSWKSHNTPRDGPTLIFRIYSRRGMLLNCVDICHCNLGSVLCNCLSTATLHVTFRNRSVKGDMPR